MEIAQEIERKAKQRTGDGQCLSDVLAAIRIECPFEGEQAAEWLLYSHTVAPFMMKFVEWLFATAASDGVKKIFFLARDGQILSKIAETLIPFNENNIECRYLLVSRQSLHLPGHICISESREWILENTDYLSIETIARRVQIQPPDLLAALGGSNRFTLNGNLSVVDRKEISRLLEVPRVASMIESSARQALFTATNYFQQEGLISDDPSPVGLVDVGWHGRLQRSIENIFEKNSISSMHLHGYYLALNDRLVFKGKDAKRLKAFMYAPAGPRHGKWVLDYVELIELLHTADHPSVMRYEKRKDGAYGAVYLPKSLNNGAGFRQDAILAFARHYAKARCDLQRSVDMPDTEKNFKRLLEWPRKAEAALFLKYEHSEHQDERQPSTYVMPRIPVKYVLHGPVKNIHGHWPSGSHAINGTLIVYRVLRLLVTIKRAIFKRASQVRKI